jgi:hypothetical protein
LKYRFEWDDEPFIDIVELKVGDGLKLKLEGSQAGQEDANNDSLFFYFSYTIIQ